MPSTNKTDFAGLNQWIGSDKPTRSDLNLDNQKIDDLLKGAPTETGINLWNSGNLLVEKGSFTPTYTDISGNPIQGITYTRQYGAYSISGTQCTIYGEIIVTNSSASSAALHLGNIPFRLSNLSTRCGINFTYAAHWGITPTGTIGVFGQLLAEKPFIAQMFWTTQNAGTTSASAVSSSSLRPGCVLSFNGSFDTIA